MVVLAQRWQALGGRLRHAHLVLFLLAALGGRHDLRGASLVRWVVKKRANVVHKKRVQEFRYLLLVGEV